MSPTIRRLLPADADAYQALRLQALAQEPGAFGSSHEEEAGRTASDLAPFLGGSDERVVFGAFDGDRLVGLAGVGRESALKSRHLAFIRSVYVDPGCRRRGVARGLMSAALGQVTAWDGVDQVTLSVTADQLAAVRLYRDMGFTECGRLPGALRVGERRLDELMMVLHLPHGSARDEALEAVPAHPSGHRSGHLPGLAPVPWHRLKALRLAWCVLGAVAAVALALSVVGPPHHVYVLASLGGSTVFLFGLTRAPAAQPRALIGGHLATATVGIACGQWLGSGPMACAVATALALGVMLVTRSVHPPAGANPIIMVQAQAPWTALLDPVLLGLGCLLAVAIPWGRLYPGMSAWPVKPLDPSPPRIDWGPWADGEP